MTTDTKQMIEAWLVTAIAPEGCIPLRMAFLDQKEAHRAAGFFTGSTIKALTTLCEAVTISNDDAQGIADVWDAAKAEAAMYVEHHCVDGKLHANAILTAKRPPIRTSATATQQAREAQRYRAMRQIFCSDTGMTLAGFDAMVDGDIAARDGASGEVPTASVMAADRRIELYLDAKNTILQALSRLPVEDRNLYVTMFQIAWHEIALEVLGSAFLCGIYDGAVEELEKAAPSRIN